MKDRRLKNEWQIISRSARKFLDETCDSLRGDREATEFKEYVIAILF
ncbi:MAG: hypothetical protein NHB14_02575 [Desulfosporosinus sp.]|nr:hypothetical protein [Desulfosporosinus sp.]